MTNVKLVKDIYQKVMNDVIDGVRETFVDEGSDEQVLLELKQMWEGRVAQSKALEEVPKVPTELATERSPVQQPVVPQQSPVHRVAPPAHQQQAGIVQQMPQAALHQAARHPVAPMLNLQGQLVALTQQQACAARQPGGFAMSGSEFGQPLGHFLVPAVQNQLMMQASSHIVQQSTRQIQIGGQTFTLAPNAVAPQHQHVTGLVDAKSASDGLDSVIQLDGMWDCGSVQLSTGNPGM